MWKSLKLSGTPVDRLITLVEILHCRVVTIPPTRLCSWSAFSFEGRERSHLSRFTQWEATDELTKPFILRFRCGLGIAHRGNRRPLLKRFRSMQKVLVRTTL